MRGKKNFFPSIHSKYLRKFRSKLIFKTNKNKAAFLCPLQGPQRCTEQAGGCCLRIQGKKNQTKKQTNKQKICFLHPSPFSKLKFISGSPVGRTTKCRATIAQGQTYSSLNRKLPNGLNSLWGSSRDDCGQSGSVPVISTWPRQSEFY